MQNNEVATTPAAMIELAVKSGTDLEKLEKLLELQERWEAGEAKKAYNKNFALAQAEVETVLKQKYNSQTRSLYADLKDVVETLKPAYTNHGFFISFSEEKTNEEKTIRIRAKIAHENGHIDTSHFIDVPLDGVGIKGASMMTAIHSKGSTLKYARRYLLGMIFNIAEEDDDAMLEKYNAPIKPPERKNKPKDANEEFFNKLIKYKNQLGMEIFKDILIKNDLKVSKMGELKNIDISIREDLLKEFQENLEKGKK